jgi:endoglucanase
VLELLKNLCVLRGVSGSEEPVRNYILSQIQGHCEYTVDSIGNILAFKRGKKAAKHTVMLSAHMDEVGLIVTSITEKGGLRFAPVGGIDPRVIFGRRVLVGASAIKGVIAAKPLHLLSSDEKGTAPSSEALTIAIGAFSRSEALRHVSLGDTATFDTQSEELGSGLLKAKALDDRAGCAILIDIIKGEIACDLHFAFVVQEEIGLRGAKCAAYSINPEFALVAEATTAADIPEVPESKRVCKLGGGAVISFMDSRTIYDKEMYKVAFELGKKLNIPLQAKEAVAGGNDAGAIHTSRSGVRTLAVSLPCRYLHSPASLISLSDLTAARGILAALGEDFAEAK